MKKINFHVLIVLSVFLVSVFALVPLSAFSAGNFDGSEVLIDAPNNLTPNTTYDFTFTVYNNATAPDGEWIHQVSMTMPSQDYIVDEVYILAPNPLHPDVVDYWETGFNPSNVTITWLVSGVVTETIIGDIREGEQLSFTFRATTDMDTTDGFFWKLHGDKGGVIGGMAWVGDADDDDVVDDDDAMDDDDFFDDDDDNDAADDDDNDGPTMPGDTSSDSSDDSKSCCG